MDVASGPKLMAAVTNVGGLGVIGVLGYPPKTLREQVSICPMSCRVRYET
jgi:NAD(P)H-dependent flavin oxidoreductase YrpB (nitropropane dioxygenase family)